MDSERTDEILGISRCVRCGHRLNGEIECPFCSMFPDAPVKSAVPKWIFITACFLSSPLSLYWIIKTDRLKAIEKVTAFTGSFFWFWFFSLWF